jgi:hypothetical protein
VSTETLWKAYHWLADNSDPNGVFPVGVTRNGRVLLVAHVFRVKQDYRKYIWWVLEVNDGEPKALKRICNY